MRCNSDVARNSRNIRNLQGLIFDFDGLIVDTEYPSFQGWTALYESHGCELPLTTYAKHIGSPGAYDLHAHLESLVGRPLNREALVEERRQRYRQLTVNQQLLPGVKEYVTTASQRGLRLGIASGSSRTWVEPHLHQFALHEHFDCITSAEDISQTKPNPEVYEKTLAALGCKPEEVIAFEDSPHGVTAAQRARIFCVAVPNGITRQLSLDHADYILESFSALPFAQLLRHFQDGE